MKLVRIFIIVSISFLFLSSNELTQKELNEKYFSVNKGSFKVLEFDKMIKSVKANDKEIIELDFVEDRAKPLQALKVFAKNIGHGNFLITFVDSTSMHIDINVIENLNDIIAVAKTIAPKLEIQQSNEKIILKGIVEDPKIKVKILDLFKKGGIEIDKNLIDLVTLTNPEKMIRLKLYAVEINNSKGLDLKNNWVVSSKNFTQNVNSDGTYYNRNINNYGSTDAQRNQLVNDAIDTNLANAVTLTGGLTGAANYLGRYFNTALTLNYLASEGVASILDETTLLTLENQDATFHAGGTIYLKIATTTNQGVPTTEVRNINYGLQLDIKAENIVNNNFVNLNINTKSTQIDWTNTVDGIPSFTEKSIKTNVVVGNQATIVLGGLISNNSSKDIEKIPLLGDIPILGMLFTSKSFKEGKSELVFFITPEIVDSHNNNQVESFDKKIEATKTSFDDKKLEKDQEK